jgi:hypothetical protein
MLLQGSRHFSDGHVTTSIGLKALPQRPHYYLYGAQGTSLPATLAPSYTPIVQLGISLCLQKGVSRAPRKGGERGGGTTGGRVDARQRDGRRRAGPDPHPLSLALSYSLSRSRSLAALVTPTTSTLVQDNTRLIFPLCSISHQPIWAGTHIDKFTGRSRDPPGPKRRQYPGQATTSTNQSSSLFIGMLKGETLHVNFTMNGHVYN